MKQQVLELLTNVEMSPEAKYNKAFELYRKSKGNDTAKVFAYNTGFSPNELKNLLYDLKKLHKITDVEIELFKKNAVKKLESEKVDKKVSRTTVEASLSDEFSNEKQSLREAFPFLNDDDCPDILKVLVADKITLWHKLKAAREVIDKTPQHSNDTPEITEAKALIVKLFEDEQAIDDELVYYRDNKKILGKHIKLKTLVIEEEIKGKTPADLHKIISNGKSALSKYRKELAEKNPDEERRMVVEDRIQTTELKMSLAKKMLGIDE